MCSEPCAVCEHQDRNLIEARILSGEPLITIERGYPLALFYHQIVCMNRQKWKTRKVKKECSDRFPLFLNSAPIVLRYRYCSACGQGSGFKFGVTQFHPYPPRSSWSWYSEGEMSIWDWLDTWSRAPDNYPGIRMEEWEGPGKESCTPYSRVHHSTKCNGWIRRFTEDEWRKLFTSIICPFTAQELEELVYGIAALADRELKDPNPKKVASIFDIPTHSHDARGYREEPRYKKMSLAEALEWHNSRLDYRRVLYKKSILRPIQPQEHTFIDPYYKQHGRTNPDYLRYNLAHRFGTRGKNQIALDYYKFPCFYTYGRPFEKLDFRSLLLYVAQPEEDSTGHIFSGPFIEELIHRINGLDPDLFEFLLPQRPYYPPGNYRPGRRAAGTVIEERTSDFGFS